MLSQNDTVAVRIVPEVDMQRDVTWVLIRLQSMCCPRPVFCRYSKAAMMAPVAYRPQDRSVMATPVRHGSPPYKDSLHLTQHFRR